MLGPHSMELTFLQDGEERSLTGRNEAGHAAPKSTVVRSSELRREHEPAHGRRLR